ncbi:periplasmic heavy metal sensor [Candidatus Halocynthiibacter alkanivorans]|uniref:periplasmic heavy metal sensor n=1 Tax=Candidatus Halocynthiibacter alkanivorans TaxID=2267619 RepID=UPI000DF448E7|nr:periplasmic heavy metal sensor [Candidatus Halocynthiibacter alkanivorans]
MGETPETTAKKKFRWSRVVLVLSLGLNLAVAGLVVGSVVRSDGFGRPPHQAMQARDLGFGPFVAALKPKDRRSIGREFALKSGPSREGMRETRARFEAMLAALKAEPYEQTVVSQLFEAMEQDRSGRLLAAKEAMLGKIESMSAQERQDYAARLDKVLKRGPGKPPRPRPN